MSAEQPTQFTEKYKTLTNTALLAIIANAADYQPVAVETARLELAGRQLNEGQVREANNALERLELQKQEQADKKLKIRNKLKGVWFSVTDVIDPLVTTNPAVDKLIRTVSIALGLLSAYKIYLQYYLIVFILTDKAPITAKDLILYFLPLIMLPAITFLFWRKKKTGWVLLVVYLICAILTTGIMFYHSMQYHNQDIHALDNLFPAISPQTYVGIFIFLGGFLAIACKKDIRSVYRVNYETWIITGVLTILFMVIQNMLL
jgi:hypothetical protein